MNNGDSFVDEKMSQGLSKFPLHLSPGPITSSISRDEAGRERICWEIVLSLFYARTREYSLSPMGSKRSALLHPSIGVSFVRAPLGYV